MGDVAKIAAALARGERAALLSPVPTRLNGDKRSLEGLARKGLAWKRGADFDWSTSRIRPVRWQLRASGYTIRTHLLSPPTDEPASPEAGRE